ncbi:Sec-independent protein translocase protein TatB [Aeromicrobium sp. Root236]|uniref:Sec-independent protein translocase protein TatB n=1 Tax=Aeromicrobium sp. Root236 TaxID=1736498 RepID=UPI0021012422|nr:Sec-independent protein translocase protein TatB [Aeromicrobium sp. Root236]
MGWPEMFVIAVVAMLVFGPDKLPGLAQQAGGFVRTVRKMAENAKAELGAELGGVDLKDLDPREVVRRAFEEEPVDADGPTVTYLENSEEEANDDRPTVTYLDGDAGRETA